MASMEYDTMLQDVANHMSRSELMRRLSTHSTSTSGSSKRSSARITKQSSASNSPNYIQRRRTTGNQTGRTCPKVSQENPYQTRDQRLRNYYSSKQLMEFPRPMSWHPGSENFQAPAQQIPTSEPALGSTIMDLENLAVSGTPASSVQQSIQDAFAMSYGYPVTATNSFYQNSPTRLQDTSFYAEPDADSYPQYSISDQVQYRSISHVPTYDMYSATNYDAPQQWPQNTSEVHMGSHQQQAMPECSAPTGTFTRTARAAKVPKAPQVPRRKSKELVGMGLYDDRKTDFMSSLNSAIGEDSNRDSVGKGLKLEETWQPPNEDVADDDEEDGYSSEEAEEVEEPPQPSILGPSPVEAQSEFYPMPYADMSNQSFFFNDDEDYATADQYAKYFAYGQDLPATQLKPQPQLNPGMENYLWF